MRLATDLWGDMDGVTLNQHAYGKGMTYWGMTLDEVLTAWEDAPDFAASGSLDNGRRRGCIGIRRTRIFILWRTRRMRRCIWMRGSA
jgi:hypothetical protein